MLKSRIGSERRLKTGGGIKPWGQSNMWSLERLWATSEGKWDVDTMRETSSKREISLGQWRKSFKKEETILVMSIYVDGSVFRATQIRTDINRHCTEGEIVKANKFGKKCSTSTVKEMRTRVALLYSKSLAKIKNLDFIKCLWMSAQANLPVPSFWRAVNSAEWICICVHPTISQLLCICTPHRLTHAPCLAY